MQNLLLRLLGNHAARRAIGTHIGSGGALDIQFGVALLRDRRVPIAAKLLALGLGAAGMALLLALEMPAEALIALFLPVLGIVSDFVVDGVEAVVGPLIIAALVLPYLAPAPVVETLRRERALSGATPATG